MNERIWTVDVDHTNTLGPLFFFVLSQFDKLFGQETMRAEKCFVFNDPNAPNPMLITDCSPIMLRTSVDTINYWSQLVFHLSHELLHYAFRQKRSNKNDVLSWYEEIVCEAMSLYGLKYATVYWRVCPLNKRNHKYGQYMNSYLKDELSSPATTLFQKCTTIEKLTEYELIAETDRGSHCNERNALYAEFLKRPMEIKHLLNYADYRTGPNRILIDFDKWYADCPYDIIRFVGKMQPCNLNDYSS